MEQVVSMMRIVMVHAEYEFEYTWNNNFENLCTSFYDFYNFLIGNEYSAFRMQ